MKVWLPYVSGGSGTDVFTQTLARVLRNSGQEVVVTKLAHKWQYFPWRLYAVPLPPETDIVLTNTWNGFAFKRGNIPLITVEHHCIFDPAYKPYRNSFQAIYHEGMVRSFELASIRKSDAVVAVSQYTANSIKKALNVQDPVVIHNGIDIDHFHPKIKAKKRKIGSPVRLLFVGNLIKRKGADLLPKIMERLGGGFELYYTSGLRTPDAFQVAPNMVPMGRLSQEALLGAYRKTDILLFPTRFEGFGYAVAEAMACGTPVIASRCSSIPELVDDGKTGRLCPINDIDAFVGAAQEMTGDVDRLKEQGELARKVAVERFSLGRMCAQYTELFNKFC